MQKYILALDQGTTSSRCIIYNKKGESVSSAQKEFTQIYPKEAWVEHDPIEILNSQLEVAKLALEKAELRAENIAAIGITNQRETVVVWDKNTGKPVHNAIVWQCRRTADYCKELRNKGFSEIFRNKTGLVIDAYFSGTKLKWIFDNVRGTREKAEKGELLFGTIDTWLIWNLTEGKLHITDYSNASRTLMFNIRTLKWDDEILELFNIPKTMLPEVKESSEIYGYVNSDILFKNLIKNETSKKNSINNIFNNNTNEKDFDCYNYSNKTLIPISGIAGDQQAALFGQTCFNKGESKNTYGTGCFLLMNTGSEPVSSKNGLLTTIAWKINGKVTYAIEGSVFVAGAAVQWLRDEMEILKNAKDSEEMALMVEDTQGVVVVPAFVGMGAPHWNPYAKGAIFGLTRGANKCHLTRATLESLALQSMDLLSAMIEDTGIEIENLNVDGGASANDFLMQFQADILDKTVERPKCVETTSLGAAYLAGLAVGYWKDLEEIENSHQVDKFFNSKMSDFERKDKIKDWEKAVKATLDWTK
ncbi:MAG: glycerol kinase GlpK [Anaerovoracaceae bacterium]